MATNSLLDNKPNLKRVISLLDSFLIETHPRFFGDSSIFPCLQIKRFKVIHDNIWGTNRFSWQEMLLIDSPILQRLRGIHQVGLAYQTYPTAHHTRFEHSLGVVIIASRTFEALLERNKSKITDIIKAIYQDCKSNDEKVGQMVSRLRQELRLAALLHDTGHCLFSHVSEVVYQHIDLLKNASLELASLVGKEKGCGEVLSFCLALTPSVSKVIKNSMHNLTGDVLASDYGGEIDFNNIALMIIGRSIHPFLQFLGDIISSAFDADKLDYLIRDATEAGLPLRYDIDMYLASIRIEQGILCDGDDELKHLYDALNTPNPTRKPAIGSNFPTYDTYRLRLPKKAMHVIEQIILCKLMLFSYLYHHRTVRAQEILVEKLISRSMHAWRTQGKTDEDIIKKLMALTDAWISARPSDQWEDDICRDYSYRATNRLMPCEIYHLSTSETSHADAALLGDFLTKLHNRAERKEQLEALQGAIGESLLVLNPKLADNADAALAKAGVWVDVPKVTKFEGIDEITVSNSDGNVVAPLLGLFPIDKWQAAYMSYRYYVRVYCFPEYFDIAEIAVKEGIQRVVNISSPDFFKIAKRDRN